MAEMSELGNLASAAAQQLSVLFMSTPLGAEARQLSCLSAVPRVTTNSISHIKHCDFSEVIDNYIWSGLL